MSSTPIDPAAIIAQHERHCPGFCEVGLHCITYRLAAELASAQDKVQRVEAMCDEMTWVRPESCPCSEPVTCCGSARNCSAMLPSTKVVSAREIRAALAGTA